MSTPTTSHPLDGSSSVAPSLPSSPRPPPPPPVPSSPHRQHQAAPAPTPTNNHGGGGGAAAAVIAADEALQVRSNLIHTVWAGFRALGRGRRWILVLRLIIGLLQVIPSIVILSLPTSLGNSVGKSLLAECDPEPIFVFLALHTVRVVANIPLDVYLGLSPHRSSRQRRPGASGQAERERRRTFGSLDLDRKAAKLADLLGFLHIVIFAVGNYAVWTRTECNAAPADSVPLWWTALAILIITYVIIFNIVLLTFLVVFFLPATLAILRVLGLTNRIPTPAIRPETGKIQKQDVEKATKLVYYVPEAGGDGGSDQQSTTTVDATTREAAAVPLPPSRAPSRLSSSGATATETMSQATPTTTRWPRFMHALVPSARRSRTKSRVPTEASSPLAPTQAGSPGSHGGLKYPLYPLPAHRSTCAICLFDFETPSAAPVEGEEEPEPLRLLPCSHVLHRSCVDEWLTSVSGRCPVCQKPLLGEEEMARRVAVAADEEDPPQAG